MILHEVVSTSTPFNNGHSARNHSYSRHNSPTPVNQDMSAASVAMPLSPSSQQKHARFATPGSISHSRGQSQSPASNFSPIPTHIRGNSIQRTSSSSTFAPQFVKSEEFRRSEERVSSIEVGIRTKLSETERDERLFKLLLPAPRSSA